VTNTIPLPLRARRADAIPLRAGLALMLAALSTGAAAHTGADAGAHHGFFDGLAHPFTGFDHLLALLAVGFAAAAHARRAWLAPAVFAAAMLGGAILARAGVQFPAVEPAIAASLLVLGALVAARARLSAAALAVPAGAFAAFHGAAHAAELHAAGFGPLAGMLAASLALLAAGLGLGFASRRASAWWARAAGAATSLAGVALLASMAARA
jgi:urease accessory protein